MRKEVEIQHSIPRIDFKGVTLFFNSSLFVINAFVLTLPKIAYPPSPIISYSLEDFSKQTFHLELTFWT